MFISRAPISLIILSRLKKQEKAVPDFITYKMSKEKTDKGFTWEEEEISL